MAGGNPLSAWDFFKAHPEFVWDNERKEKEVESRYLDGHKIRKIAEFMGWTKDRVIAVLKKRNVWRGAKTGGRREAARNLG